MGIPTNRKLYLATIDAFVEPIMVVPDVSSGLEHKYFHVKPRKDWAPLFTQWVCAPHQVDAMPQNMSDVIPNNAKEPKRTEKNQSQTEKNTSQGPNRPNKRCNSAAK